MARYEKNKSSKSVKKSKILIIADGETEINYIKEFIKKFTILNHKYNIEYKPNLAMTKTLLNHIKRVEIKYDYIIALSDKDNINNDSEVFNSFCESFKIYNNLTCGYSNPCFELWLLLHEKYRETEVSTTELVKVFEKKLNKRYKTDKGIFSYFETSYLNAIENAERLEAFWTGLKTSYSKSNPRTSVHMVIKKLLKLGKIRS